MRIAFVGDVHGHLQQLTRLLLRLERHGVDRICLLGDLVDRGPDSLGCLRVAESWSFTARDGQRRLLDVVRGNHENKYVYVLRGWKLPFEDRIPTPESFEIAAQLTPADVDFMDSLPYVVNFNGDGLNLTAVHGGFMPWMRTPGWYGRQMGYLVSRVAYIGEYGKVRSSHQPNERFWANEYDGRFGEVYFGHTSHERISYYDHAVACDVSKLGSVGAVVRSSEPDDEPYTEFYEDHGYTIAKHGPKAASYATTKPTTTPRFDTLSLFSSLS